MSRDFVPSGNDLHRATGSPWQVGAGPVSMSALVFKDAVGSGDQSVLCNGWRNVFDRCFQLRVQTGGTALVDTLDSGLTGHNANKSGFTVGAWHQIGWDYIGSSGAIRLYIDGVAGTPSTSGSALRNSNSDVYIGSSRLNSTPQYWDGAICEVAVWQAILTADEWLALAKGVSPLWVRPGARAAYYPIWGLGSAEPDLTPGGTLMTIEGSLPQRDHGPVGHSFPLAA